MKEAKLNERLKNTDMIIMRQETSRYPTHSKYDVLSDVVEVIVALSDGRWRKMTFERRDTLESNFLG